MSSAQTGRGILKNSVHGLMSWVLPLALSFLATPVIVKSLGLVDYGIYALIVGFIGYSFSFSIGRAITKYVAEYRQSGETEKIADIISTTLLLNLCVGIAGVAAIVVSAEWLVASVLRIEAGLQERSIRGLYIAALVIFFTMLTQVFSAIVQGLHRFDIYSRITNASGLLLVVGNVILAWVGFGLQVLLGWCLFTTVLSAVAFIISAKRLLPEFQFRLRPDREARQLVLRYSFGVIAYQILANIVLLFERGWIVRKLGPETLTYYVVAMTLGMYIHGLIASLMIVIFPLASELNDDRERLKRLYLKATKIACGIVIFLVGTLIALSEPFLAVYVGAEIATNAAHLLVLHVMSFGAAAILIVTWQMTEGLGHPGLNFRIFLVCAALCLPLMVLLVEPYGSFGVALARLVGFGAMFFSIFYVERRTFGAVQMQFWARITGMLAVAIAVSVAVERLILSSFSVSFGLVAGAVAAGAMVYAAALWLIGFVTEEERAFARRILNRGNA